MHKRGQNRSFSICNLSSKNHKGQRPIISSRRNRRGLSTIIVTLILIVISLVAVAIFWVVVRNLLQTGTEGIGLGRYTLSGNIKNVNLDNSTNNVSLTVERNPGQGEINGIEFIFSDGTDSEVVKETASMKELESRKFYFHLTKLNVSNLKSISIAFLIKENDKETLGDVVDKYNVGEGGGGGGTSGGACSSTTCSALGYECGAWSNGSCSGTLNCGTCSGGQTCNATGSCQAGSCSPSTCISLGYQCGSGYTNGTCSGTLNCGNCETGYSCNASARCVVSSCVPSVNPCGTAICGNVANGTCGQISCGTCPGGQNCVGGSCVAQTGNYYYVRQGATGSNNGSDWTNAFTELPNSYSSGFYYTNLNRGATYYIADGDYSSKSLVFYTTESGVQYITIKKATSNDHGTNTGWQSSYGDGQANWATLWIARSYYKFDGQTGGGPGSWTSGYGFEIYSTPSADTNYVTIGKNSNEVNNVEIKHVKVGGPSPPTAGYGRGAYLPPTYPARRNITLSYNYFHDCGDVMVTTYDGIYNLLLEYNRFERTASSETSHGTGIELGDVRGADIRYNQFVDIIGTGIIGGYNTASNDILDNIKIYGNLFFNTPSFFPPGAWNGIVYTVSGALGTVSNWAFHDNTIYMVEPVSINVGICESYSNCVSSGHTAYNNLFYVNQAPSWNDVDHSNNACNHAISETNFQPLTSNPFVDSTNYDFHLTAGTTAGMTLSSPYNVDMEGNTRGADGVWDRGAYEYQ